MNDNGSFIHDTAQIKDSKLGRIKLFRNTSIIDSVLDNGCSIGDDSVVERCSFENNVMINRRSFINDSYLGRYTYAGINTIINYSKIGRFCSIGRNVDIGGADHDYRKVSMLPAFRFYQALEGGGKIVRSSDQRNLCEIGNDVWISAGAQILRKAKIGDGAVIGAGAVVTKDIPPYAIAVGIPASVTGYRCTENQIRELEEIRWWDWPESTILKNMETLMNRDISDETINYLKHISP